MAAVIFSIVLAPLFFGFCWAVGRVAPRTWLLIGPAPYLQHVVFGFSLLVVILRIPYREDQSLALAYGTIAGLFAFSVVREVWRHRAWFRRARNLSVSDVKEVWVRHAPALSPFVPGLLVVLAPVILSGALNWQHFGPDFDGDLISADYLRNSHRFSDLMREFRDAAGTSDWWQLQHTPYAHPDFQVVVAVEFFVRSLRFGHAALTAFISDAASLPVWASFFTLCVCANLMTACVISEAARRRDIGFERIFCIAIIYFLSQNYIMLNYEGISIQMIATSILLFFILNWRDVLRPERTLGGLFVLGIILTSMISIFGEGLQILAVFFASCLIMRLVFPEERQSTASAALALVKIGVVTALIAPTFFIDFLLWTQGRVAERFYGGALHGDWSLIAILLSLPEITIAPKLPPVIFLTDTYFGRLVEAAVIMGTAVWAHRRNPRAGSDLGCVALTLFIFSLAGHTYAIWKVAIILQAAFLLAVMDMLPVRIGPISALNAARAYALVVGLVGLVTIGLYWQRSNPLYVAQFNVDRHLVADKQVAIVTPSTERTYLRLAETGPAIWANGGWRRDAIEPDFSIGHNENLELALYYDCDSEGVEACGKIKAKNGDALPPRTVVPIGQSLSTLLKADGEVDRVRLNAFILDRFGIPAQ